MPDKKKKHSKKKILIEQILFVTRRSWQIISDLYSQDFGEWRPYPVTTVRVKPEQALAQKSFTTKITEVTVVSPAELTNIMLAISHLHQCVSV